MKTIEVYDEPLCCSTGVCGPTVDAALPRFAADLDWLQTQGHRVQRYNLAQQPQAFIENPQVHQLLATQGTDCLPLVVVDGRIVSQRRYPPRDSLALWTGSSVALPIGAPQGCCGGAAGGAPEDASSACCVEDEQAKQAGASGCGCSASGCC